MSYGAMQLPVSPDPSYYQYYNEQVAFYAPTEATGSESPLTQSQVPTQKSPFITGETTVISISTAFYPGAHTTLESDVCFASSDMVHFYVHSQIIKAASEKAFSSFLSGSLSEARFRDVVINIPEESPALNTILHTLYNMSCAQNSPTLQTLVTAVRRMPFYDIRPNKFIQPGAPLYIHLLSYAPLYPIDVYTLAGQFDLEALAINSSSHLLSYPLSSITDEMAQRMGAIYLRRLMCLHIGRNLALKRILLVQPPPHPPTNECNFENQKKLTRTWALVSAYLVWDSRPDLSTSTIRRTLEPLVEQLTCLECHKALEQRIKDVMVQWASVKRTI
ncbi:hypothetical protein APHAL10511_000411 [Amanita phalloides]|nr:hypothetical protein APHAL10511_000411 [Amanita phalloides]